MHPCARSKCGSRCLQVSRPFGFSSCPLPATNLAKHNRAGAPVFLRHVVLAKDGHRGFAVEVVRCAEPYSHSLGKLRQPYSHWVSEPATQPLGGAHNAWAGKRTGGWDRVRCSCFRDAKLC